MKYYYKILKIYYDSTSKLFLDIRIRIPGNYTTLKRKKKGKKRNNVRSQFPAEKLESQFTVIVKNTPLTSQALSECIPSRS